MQDDDANVPHLLVPVPLSPVLLPPRRKIMHVVNEKLGLEPDARPR
jgi:hypothetical protein